ncbi:hypothetical protein HYN59_01875 [Flavobacterium album]|uniref:Uncharacterized protein n=1 Tax=Flavobacterium album TaxID=2175091 RepID=A0A2S1QU74_9FLAO|nr:hypothetical protein HYN59_01875 [Flavobacterium album]
MAAVNPDSWLTRICKLAKFFRSRFIFKAELCGMAAGTPYEVSFFMQVKHQKNTASADLF